MVTITRYDYHSHFHLYSATYTIPNDDENISGSTIPVIVLLVQHRTGSMDKIRLVRPSIRQTAITMQSIPSLYREASLFASYTTYAVL